MSTSNVKTNRQRAFVCQDRRCYYCGVRMWLASPQELPGVLLSQKAADKLRCTAEHLVAQCDGGTNAASNIVAACAHCNHKRHKRKIPPEPEAYREQVRRRMEQGRWHPRPIFELGLASQQTTL